MEQEKSTGLWEKYYSFFPEVELPVTLSEEYTSIFNKFNKPLPGELIEEFILEKHLFFANEDAVDDLEEIEEFMPCFRLPEDKNYFALVYWKASLLKYEYILHTYDTKGKSIARQILASTSSDGKNIRQIVATIDPDLDIYIIGGDSPAGEIYNPESSKAFSMEITPKGQIIHHFEDN